jgi:hypothetical protein
MTITFGHHLPMRLFLQQSNGLDARPFKVHNSAHFLKMQSKPTQGLFSIIDLAKWAPRITNILICKMNI